MAEADGKPADKGPAVSAGMAAARARGVRIGRPPAELPSSAARVAGLRDAGKSLAAIAATLNAEGIASPRGGTWQKGSVAYVLKRWDETQRQSL